MNLLDKLTHLLKSGSAILLIPIFFACQDPSQLGLELETDDNQTETFAKEFDLPLSTVYIDSLRTDHLNFTLFGQYQDNISGKIRATSYNQYHAFGGTLPADTLTFSSAYIIMEVRDIRSAGSLAGESIEVFEVNDTIYGQPVYLRERSMEMESTPIGSKTFDFAFPNDSVINIPIADEIGLSLFKKIKLASDSAHAEMSDDYSDSLYLKLYHYQPLAFVPGASNQGLYAFDLASDTSSLVVEMKGSNNDLYHYYFRFTEPHFSQIERDRSSSKFSTLIDDYQESSGSDNVYLDMPAGLYPKLDFSNYNDFIQTQENFVISRATLTLNTGKKSTLINIRDVKNIQGLFVKENGRINATALVNNSSLSNAVHYALLDELNYTSGSATSIHTISHDSDSLNYFANVTLFSQAIADNFSFNDELLVEQLIMFGVNSLDVGQTEFINPEAKLKIYYTTLKN